MRKPTTIKGYINLLKEIDKIPLFGLKGYLELPEESKNALSNITGEISNLIDEL